MKNHAFSESLNFCFHPTQTTYLIIAYHSLSVNTFVHTAEAVHSNFSGNVGIGTTAPAGPLHISNSNSYQPMVYIENTNNDANAGYLILDKKPTDDTLVANDSLGTVIFRGVDTGGTMRAASRLTSQVVSQGANFVSSNLNFMTVDSTGVNDSRMVIAEDGNVGIGTTTPGVKLDVNGTVRGHKGATEIDSFN